MISKRIILVLSILPFLHGKIISQENNQNNKNCHGLWGQGQVFFNSAKDMQNKRSVTISTESGSDYIATTINEYENGSSCFTVQHFVNCIPQRNLLENFQKQLKKCNEIAQSPIARSRLLFLGHAHHALNHPLFEKIESQYSKTQDKNKSSSPYSLEYLTGDTITIAIDKDKQEISVERSIKDTWETADKK